MTRPAVEHRVVDPGGGGEAVEVELHSPLPRELETGLGQFLVVSGDCRAGDDRVEQIIVEGAGRAQPAELSPIPGGVSFWQALLIPAGETGESVPVTLDVRLRSGRVVGRALGSVACRDVDWQPVSPPAGAGPGLVAVCMATYNPEPDAFRRQADSIRSQTHENWVCIINDDGTESEVWNAMREHCAGEGRFVFFRNPQNLGFYRNFEKALTRVPGAAEYVAFSDQDDFWYPDKLARLMEALRRDDAVLAYSDMRIVDTGGGRIADSYWVNRKNEYRDLRVVLVANTVTGAASLFRRSILPRLVPFPPCVGDAFHDHWLACVALSTGSVSYVDEPLYDYYQYGGSVIGHCDFVRFSIPQRVASFARFCVRLCRPQVARPLLKGKYASALAIYRGECRRLRLIEGTIRQRCRVDAWLKRRLHSFDGGPGSVLKLLWLHAMVLLRGQTTDDAELRLAMGEAARIVERRRYERQK